MMARGCRLSVLPGGAERAERPACDQWLPLLFLLFLCSCSDIMAQQMLRTQVQAADPEDSLFSLVTASGNSYSLPETGAAVGLIAGSAERSPLMFFVHGMGDYPEKAFKDHALERLESLYAARVIMFHWPSWIDFRTIPRGNALSSGTRLAGLFRDLDRMRRQPGVPLNGMRRVLLVHSLGCEVLKGALREYQGGLARGLFNAVIIAAPETDLRGHAAWLEKLDFSDTVVVLLGSQDHVLAQVWSHLQEERLGMGLTNRDGSAEPLARKTTYVLTGNGSDWHRFYVERQSPALERLFRTLVSGDGDVHRGLDPIMTRRPNVYALKP